MNMNIIDRTVFEAQQKVIEEHLKKGDEVILINGLCGHPIIITISKKES